ncbi:hypothetical protein F5B19DRAFT_267668 [Rostrohypoxylon terebratum]|nr:hypothetical protein F5B19DRAFT_267668 [Rostrohypoxylon terebratum]
MSADSVWDFGDASDLTFHPMLSPQGYLDETLEEFYRLQRLGHFASAEEFFEENLREHIEDPQVLIAYAEHLLEQGNYDALSRMGDDAMRRACDNLVNSDDRLLLTMYWKLIREFTTYYKPYRPRMPLTRRVVVHESISQESPMGTADEREMTSIEDIMDKFRAMVIAKGKDITSTEIKVLGLIYRLCSVTDEPILHVRLREFPSSFHAELYANLLGEGRIWDFRDLCVSSTLEHTFIPEYCGNVRKVYEDWSSTTTDTSATLALLEIIASHLIYKLDGPLAAIINDVEFMIRRCQRLVRLIMENDGGSMKNRPFLKWMLATVQFIDVEGPHNARSYAEQLEAWPGILLPSRRYLLPQYVPERVENPGWKVGDADLLLVGPIRTVLRVSRELGDYDIEAMILKRLIMLLENTAKEFEELCNLQSVMQGDIFGYSKTLASKYLISDTDDLKQDLKSKISGLSDIPYFYDSLSPLDSWTLDVLRDSLGGGSAV